MSSNRTSGFVFHELYMWHDTGSASSVFPAGLTIEPGEHAENPDTKRRFRNLLEVSGLLERLSAVRPRPATEDEIARFHTRDYIARIKKLSAERGGDAGDLTPFGAGSFEIAQLAAGGTIRAVESVLSGEIANAYALVRPPGHHAERDRAMGFCFFNNVAVGALHALNALGVERVALVDFDVHHGNGSEDILASDPRVLMCSTFQRGLYPFLGDEPKGLNMVNVGLPAGATGENLRAAVQEYWMPALDAFAPQLLFISAGFDAHQADDMAAMRWVESDYAWVTRELVRAAHRHCGGRVVSLLEGGYHLHALSRSVAAHVRELIGA